MIIHECDRFGLSDLHQLRGRVGRYKHRAYCYLILPERRTVNPAAAKRLKAIEDFSDLGAGFQIAMRDLEIRGAGNILGREQSGHIATVGYELYCQLLEQAVGSLRGEKKPPPPDVHIEIGIDAYIPKTYIPSERQATGDLSPDGPLPGRRRTVPPRAPTSPTPSARRRPGWTSSSTSPNSASTPPGWGSAASSA